MVQKALVSVLRKETGLCVRRGELMRAYRLFAPTDRAAEAKQRFCADSQHKIAYRTHQICRNRAAVVSWPGQGGKGPELQR